MPNKLLTAYQAMLDRFGPQHWWPAEGPFEVMVGAILTQNTSWKNVERAIANIKSANLMDPFKLFEISEERLAELIRPAGYFRVKAKRLRNFLEHFIIRYDADIERMSGLSVSTLREDLLSVSGLGPETVDSILLYALGKPIFVIDAYTKRIMFRHNMCEEWADYHELQDYFMSNLSDDPALFNEYHALLVEVGKNFCRPKGPRCPECPLSGWNGVSSFSARSP